MISRREFLKLVSGAAAGSFLLPFTKQDKRFRRVYLFDTYIAGFQYHQGMQIEVAETLIPETDLILAREPDNPYDELAIGVFTKQGHQVGYVPRGENEIPAAIADQDILLGAEIVKFDPAKSPWERLLVRVFQVIPET